MSELGAVAFLGPEGTYCHEAALQILARERVACRSIRGVFRAVLSGPCDAGVVPGENVLEGAVNETLDQLLRTPLLVSGEVSLPIHHCLLGHPGARVERIYSHPQALAQCGDWIDQHFPNASTVDCASTAEAASMAAGDSGGAAIAGGPRAALVVLERDLCPSGNRTRFFLVSREAGSATGRDRSLVAFVSPHRPGALLACLQPFAAAGINLSRLEHRPSGLQTWTYHFIAEIEGHPDDPSAARALENLRAVASEVRILGAWRAP